MKECIRTDDRLTYALASRAGSLTLDPTPARHFRGALVGRDSDIPVTCPLTPLIRLEDYGSSRPDLNIVQPNSPARLSRQLVIFDSIH